MELTIKISRHTGLFISTTIDMETLTVMITLATSTWALPWLESIARAMGLLP